MFTLLGVDDEPSYGPVGQRAIDNAISLFRSLPT
jgi:hypothetical protein